MTNCLKCGAAKPPSELHGGWIVEKRPTLGGGIIRFILCFACRYRTLIAKSRPNP